MKTVLKTVVTALAASVAAAASAGKAKTAFEAAAENKALVDRYAKSIATVRYYMKKDAEGVSPKFEVPYRCPNCGDTHWRDSGVSVEKRIPAEFAGFVLGPDEVLMQDIMAGPEYVERIEVEVAGERVAAVEGSALPGHGAVVLKTERPFASAVPLAFTGKGAPDDPRYFYMVREAGRTVAGLAESGMAKFRRIVEIGRDVYEVKPNTIVIDSNGDAVTVAMQDKAFIGEEEFAPPSEWRREPAADRFARKAEFEKSLAKSILPAYIQLEASPRESGSRMRFSFSSSSDDASGNDIDTTLVLLEGGAFLTVALPPQATARIVKMEATLPDGTKAPLDFVGSVKEHGAIAVKFRDGAPAGLVPLKLDRRPALAHFGERVRVASAINKAGTLDVKSGVSDIWEFVRVEGNETAIEIPFRVNGVAIDDEGRDRMRRSAIAFSDVGVVSVALADRKGSRSWDSNDDVQGAILARIVDNTEFDTENVPRKAGERKRSPWLGVEVQTAGAEVLREKKATGFFKSYKAERAALVTSVAEGSPAAELGIAEGDVLLSARYPGGGEQDLLVDRDYSSGMNWLEMFGDDRFIEIGNTGRMMPWPDLEGGINGVLAEKFSVGAEVVVAWVSGGRRREGTCRLALAPVHYANAPHARSKELGMTVKDMTPEVRKYFKFDEKAPGVVVSKVKSGGIAAVAGIRPLELILEVDGQGVTSAKDFAERVKGRKEISFNVRRLTETRIVPVKVD